MNSNATKPATNDSKGLSASARERAIDAYDNTRERVSDTLSEAPLIALAGGLAAGALIAALLPRTRTEARLVRPTAKRVKATARAAYEAAKETGSGRLDELGLNREKGGQTFRSLFEGVTDAARASGQAALDAARKQG
ncbi:MAG: hypothetical protein ABI770_00620 [Sphingomicrobium sp.]